MEHQINYTCTHQYGLHTPDCSVGQRRLAALAQEPTGAVSVAGKRVGQIRPVFAGEEWIVFSLTGAVSHGVNCSGYPAAQAIALSTQLDGVFGVAHAYTGDYAGLF